MGDKDVLGLSALELARRWEENHMQHNGEDIAAACRRRTYKSQEKSWIGWEVSWGG